MSVLLIDPLPELGRAIIELLLSEGDEVRVLTPNPSEWEGFGAFVAPGDPMDADLVERACTNVRTIVFTFDQRKGQAPAVGAVLPPARSAGVDRVVVCSPSAEGAIEGLLEAMDHVVLVTGRRGFVPKRTIAADRVAAAVSAADDLAGNPRLKVDLTDEGGWELLGAHA